MGRILVVGALGQIGTDLVTALVKKYGSDNVIASDIRDPQQDPGCAFEILDATDENRFKELVTHYQIDTIYHLAATLSAKAENNPLFSWDLNMKSLLITLELGKSGAIEKLFWPSSIAVFGPTTPKSNTPQKTITEPNSVYGISKLAGERWCEYYHEKYGVDVRSVRYPGLIGYNSLPGGGTTDYAVDIYHKAVKGQRFECFLEKDCVLPMMYMPDAIRGTLELMDADPKLVKERSSYNFSAFSFSPEQIADVIRAELPGFEIAYAPDQRQEIAGTWPDSINDAAARADWGWKNEFSLESMTRDMLKNLS